MTALGDHGFMELGIDDSSARSIMEWEENGFTQS